MPKKIQQCKSNTKAGRKCSRNSQSNGFCWQHIKQKGSGVSLDKFTHMTVYNWNIMDHKSTAFSRLGNVETEEEFEQRYNEIIHIITTNLRLKSIDIFCIEEATAEFIQLLNKNIYIKDNYDVLIHQKKNFYLITLIKKSLNYIDYSNKYQDYYEKQKNNIGQPSRAQIILFNNFILVHIHLAGSPGSYGNPIRQLSLLTILNYLKEKLPDHKKIIIGDFNINQNNLEEVLQPINKKYHLLYFHDENPTSFHRFVRHDNINTSLSTSNTNPYTGCQLRYEDKRNTYKMMYQKVDHLLYSPGIIISPLYFDLQPEYFTTYEFPYTALIDNNNLEFFDIATNCETRRKLYSLQLIKDINNVMFFRNPWWPSDHTLLGYNIRLLKKTP